MKLYHYSVDSYHGSKHLTNDYTNQPYGRETLQNFDYPVSGCSQRPQVLILTCGQEAGSPVASIFYCKPSDHLIKGFDGFPFPPRGRTENHFDVAAAISLDYSIQNNLTSNNDQNSSFPEA